MVNENGSANDTKRARQLGKAKMSVRIGSRTGQPHSLDVETYKQRKFQ